MNSLPLIEMLKKTKDEDKIKAVREKVNYHISRLSGKKSAQLLTAYKKAQNGNDLDHQELSIINRPRGVIENCAEEVGSTKSCVVCSIFL